ncbi:hypothetical protein [Streptomyces achromogenes]|uniref:hypothetical protein n=1 Tax=Streptomyces achromogenes TaxID=67255 RepID=UPI0036B504C8
MQALRRSAQAVVDELGKAVTLGTALRAPSSAPCRDHARQLVDQITPNAQAVDRLAAETVIRVTATHRSILRAVVDGFRQSVAEVTATPLLGTRHPQAGRAGRHAPVCRIFELGSGCSRPVAPSQTMNAG